MPGIKRVRGRGRSTVALLCACALAGLSFSTTAAADDAARISYLESEIRLLRTRLDEQSRRIQQLEAQLERLSGGASPQPAPKRRVNEMRTDRPPSAGPLPWQSAPAWERVAKGMTQDQVTAILGEPTMVESLDSYKTLFYRGPAANGGDADGHVNLKDDRVVAIRKPDFQPVK
jgi:cell division protein FtsB